MNVPTEHTLIISVHVVLVKDGKGRSGWNGWTDGRTDGQTNE